MGWGGGVFQNLVFFPSFFDTGFGFDVCVGVLSVVLFAGLNVFLLRDCCDVHVQFSFAKVSLFICCQ